MNIKLLLVCVLLLDQYDGDTLSMCLDFSWYSAVLWI